MTWWQWVIETDRPYIERPILGVAFQVFTRLIILAGIYTAFVILRIWHLDRFFVDRTDVHEH